MRAYRTQQAPATTKAMDPATMKMLLMTEKKSRQTVSGRECCSALPSGVMVRMRRAQSSMGIETIKGLFHHTAGINLWSVPRSQDPAVKHGSTQKQHFSQKDEPDVLLSYI